MKKLLLACLYFIVHFFYKKSGLSIKENSALAGETVEIFSNIPDLKADTEFASQNEWFKNLNELKKNIISGFTKKFLRIRVVQDTMFVLYANYTKLELNALKTSPNWKSRWKHAIRETVVGRPYPYLFWPLSSSNLIHHAYHIHQFEKYSEKQIENLNLIFEFGGGYGSMCRLCKELNFNGLYIIFDFFHFSKIQRFFLKSIGYKEVSLEKALNGENGFICLSDFSELSQLLSSRSADYDKALFIATWSLSESPLAVREKVEKQIVKFENILIAYQANFNEVDNDKYFKNLLNAAKRKFDNEEIPFLKGNHYCFSKSK